MPLKEREQLARAVLHTFARYQDAERTTATARARTAKQFEQFMQPDNVRLFPNLKWLPSRSVDIRTTHREFYNHIWAKDDAFWNFNAPGTEWNCKCDVEETDEPVTDDNPQGITKQEDALPGIEGNPAQTGEVFTDNASYIRNAGRNRQQVEEFIGKILHWHDDFILYKRNPEYADVYYDYNHGGMVAVHREHNYELKVGKFSIPRGDYEKLAAEGLAQNGHQVILRGELGESGVKQPDGYVDGILMDIKGIEGNPLYALNRANTQQVNTAVLYFHDASAFSLSDVRTKWEQLPEWINNNDHILNKTIYLRSVMCVVKESSGYKVYEIKNPE